MHIVCCVYMCWRFSLCVCRHVHVHMLGTKSSEALGDRSLGGHECHEGLGKSTLERNSRLGKNAKLSTKPPKSSKTCGLTGFV